MTNCMKMVARILIFGECEGWRVNGEICDYLYISVSRPSSKSAEICGLGSINKVSKQVK